MVFDFALSVKLLKFQLKFRRKTSFESGLTVFVGAVKFVVHLAIHLEIRKSSKYQLRHQALYQFHTVNGAAIQEGIQVVVVVSLITQFFEI
jgi:hypothetical protein